MAATKTTSSKTTRKVQVPGASADTANESTAKTADDQAQRLPDVPDSLELANGTVLDYPGIVDAMNHRGFDAAVWLASTEAERAEFLEALKLDDPSQDRDLGAAALDWTAADGELVTDESEGPAAEYVEHEVPGELLDATDVDATKITRAVLTKQGWVIPSAPATKA